MTRSIACEFSSRCEHLGEQSLLPLYCYEIGAVELARIHIDRGNTNETGTHIWTFTHVRERYDLLASKWCGHFSFTCNFCRLFLRINQRDAEVLIKSLPASNVLLTYC